MVTLGAILLLNSKTSPSEYSWFVQAQLYFLYKIFGSKVKIEKRFFWVTGLWDKIVRNSRELLFKHNWRSRESRSPDRENEADRQRRMWEDNPVFILAVFVPEAQPLFCLWLPAIVPHIRSLTWVSLGENQSVCMAAFHSAFSSF